MLIKDHEVDRVSSSLVASIPLERMEGIEMMQMILKSGHLLGSSRLDQCECSIGKKVDWSCRQEECRSRSCVFSLCLCGCVFEGDVEMNVNRDVMR